LTTKTKGKARRVKSARAKAGTKKPRTKFLKNGEVKEAYVQAEILAWLRTTGLLHWRSNSGSLFLHGRHINLGPLGCADISLVLPTHGTFVGLEVKSAKGKIRPDQITYAKGLTAMGGKYYIVRSLEDAKNAVAECLGENAWKQLSERMKGG
jgi:hypothetical protein